MLLLLLLIPLIGIFIIYTTISYPQDQNVSGENLNKIEIVTKKIKLIALFTSIINLFLSLLIFISYEFSSNLFQFVREYYKISFFDIYLGIDGISIYFVLLTTIIIPISLLSN